MRLLHLTRAIAAVAVVAVVAVVSGCKAQPAGQGGAAQSDAFVPIAIGDTVTSYVAVSTRGDTVRIGANEPLTLVNVWATWCESCREEMADLESLQKQFGARGLRIVAVSVDEGDGERVNRFAEHEKLTMTIVHDPSARIQDVFSTAGVPESYLVSTSGTLLWRQAGGLHGAPEKAAESIELALKGGLPGA